MHGRRDGSGREVEGLDHEVVRVLCLDAERLESGGGEVLEVEGDDGLSADPDGRGEHVAVVFIG